jgi:hypothetical protein
MQSPPTEDDGTSIPNTSRENEVAPILSHIISMQSPPTPTEDDEASKPNTSGDNEVAPIPSHIISIQSSPPTPTADDEASIPNTSKNTSRGNKVAPIPSHIISMQSPPTPTEDDEASIPNTSKNTSRGNEVAPIPSHIISMQSPPTPTADDEPSIPTEHVRDGPNLNRTVAARRKAAKRTHPWDLVVGGLHLVSPPPQAEDNLARKKPRLEEPLPTTTDKAAKTATSPDTSLGLPPPPATDANADPGTNTQPNAGATRATGRWTLEEDAELTYAAANTSKKKHGKDYTTDWIAIFALVPGRTKSQCKNRWKDVLDPSIDRTNSRTGKWGEDEDSKLKDAVETQGD